MTHTTTPTIPAGEIIEIVAAYGVRFPVVFSDETAHERVAIVRLQGGHEYHLAVWAVDGKGRGAWNLLPSAYRTVRDALALVPAVVLTHLA
jgi:hypothetical protein